MYTGGFVRISGMRQKINAFSHPILDSEQFDETVRVPGNPEERVEEGGKSGFSSPGKRIRARDGDEKRASRDFHGEMTGCGAPAD
jgi:hypothetical protein